MPSRDDSSEFSFKPVLPTEEAPVPLWLRTTVQEAFADQTGLALKQLKSGIFKDEEVHRVFEELRALKNSWTEPEFIEAALGDKRWRRLLLEYLQTDEESGSRLDRVAESLEKIRGLLKSEELPEKLKKPLEKVERLLRLESRGRGESGSAMATIFSSALIGVVVGSLIVYSLKASLHLDVDAGRVTPLTIPMTIQPTIQPGVDLAGIKAQLKNPIPITLQPETNDKRLKEGLDIPINLTLTADGVRLPATSGSSATTPLEVHITSDCCKGQNSGNANANGGSAGNPQNIANEPKIIQVTSGRDYWFELNSPGAPCKAKVRVRKIASNEASGIQIGICPSDVPGGFMDDFRDIDLALAVSDKDCKTLSHTGWQVKLDAIQSPDRRPRY